VLRGLLSSSLACISPIFPNLLGQDSPHQGPVTQCTSLLPLLKPLRIILPKDVHIPFYGVGIIIRNLVLWQQKHFPRTTAKEIGFSGLSECYLVLRIRAEYHHIGEISTIGRELDSRGTLSLSEDAAGGEDRFDGLNYDMGRW
jgi:hypothetical protein